MTSTLAVAAMALSGCTSPPAETEPSYGSLPTFLAAAAILPDSIHTDSTEVLPIDIADFSSIDHLGIADRSSSPAAGIR